MTEQRASPFIDAASAVGFASSVVAGSACNRGGPAVPALPGMSCPGVLLPCSQPVNMRCGGMQYHRGIVRIFPVLLRVLLTLALIANGTGSVFAATRMQLESFNTHAAGIDPVQSEQLAVEACDEHAGMDALAMEANGMPSQMAGDAPVSDDGSPDCCKPGQCMCACMLHGVGGMARVQVMEPLIDRDTTARVLETGHAAPALPHLIRPPIG